MRLMSDYRHDLTARNGFAAFCRVRVFETEAGDEHDMVVLVSEPDTKTYDGPSVTNNIEQIAAEVVMRFALPTRMSTIIKHYPPEAEPAVALFGGSVRPST